METRRNLVQALIEDNPEAAQLYVVNERFHHAIEFLCETYLPAIVQGLCDRAQNEERETFHLHSPHDAGHHHHVDDAHVDHEPVGEYTGLAAEAFLDHTDPSSAR